MAIAGVNDDASTPFVSRHANGEGAGSMSTSSSSSNLEELHVVHNLLHDASVAGITIRFLCLTCRLFYTFLRRHRSPHRVGGSDDAEIRNDLVTLGIIATYFMYAELIR
jgi:hypothetical protein